MRCLVAGGRREDFVTARESGTEALREDLTARVAAVSADEHWRLLAGAVRSAATEVFPQKGVVDPDYQRLADEHVDLLAMRRRLNEEMRDDDHLETDQLELLLRTRRCRRLPSAFFQAHQEALTEELWQMWRDRRFFDVHRLRVRLSGSGYGTRRRVLLAPRPDRPDA